MRYSTTLWGISRKNKYGVRCGLLTNNGYPYLYDSDAVPKGPGAFCYAEKLIKVSIPESVKKIGKEAFRYTALRKVRIAADCKYYDTSFPPDCEITFYDDIDKSHITNLSGGTT